MDCEPQFYGCLGCVMRNYVTYTDVIEGFRGVMYQPRFFDVEKLKSLPTPDAPDDFFQADDVWFSGWLVAVNVPRLLVSAALNGNAAVYQMLVNMNATRGLSPSVNERSKADREADRARKEPLRFKETFFTSNEIAVRWFEQYSSCSVG